MDSSSVSNRLDIFEVYRRYCEVISQEYAIGGDGYRPANGSKKAKLHRNALSQLLELVESRVNKRMPMLEELPILMSRLDLMVDSCEFSRFYNFVFFICRENGQRSITVSRAIIAWKLVLSGRFRLLNQWCSFIERNQRHNISEDTWRQVLAFSRCVHENLEGYDPEAEVLVYREVPCVPLHSLRPETPHLKVGAWPVLIDEFVEHMYSINGSEDGRSFCCSCGDSESQSVDESLPGLKIFPGVKRKLGEDIEDQEFSNSNMIMNLKRRHTDLGLKIFPGVKRKLGEDIEDQEFSNSNMIMNLKRRHTDLGDKSMVSPLGSSKSPCAVEGSLAKGFAELFSSLSSLHFDHERRVS